MGGQPTTAITMRKGPRPFRSGGPCALALFVTLLRIPGAAAEPVITDGEDWSLPAWVKPEPYSGFYAMDARKADPRIRHVGLTLTWRHLNPADGVYDFRSLEEGLAEATRRGGMVLFRLKASVVDGAEQGTTGREREFVPQWVLDNYQPKTFRTSATKRYVAAWDPGVQQAFLALVREIGRRGYMASPQLLAIYLHGFSRSSGEEMNIREPEFTAEAKAAGLTADALMRCWRERIDAWAEAAGAQRGKVVWVGAGGVAGLEYPAEELDSYAEQRGLGLRGGFLEHYYYMHLHPPRAGQAYAGDNVVSDWSAPLRDGRYFGDEYESENEFRTATADMRAIMSRSSFFRAAQVGMNFLWVSKATLDWAGDVPHWYTLVAGRGPTRSPDAACWLREACVRRQHGVAAGQPWKNMERLLMQRDVDGARSVGDERMELPYVQPKDRNHLEEFTARRTNVAAGQPDLVFRLDETFRRSLSGDVDLKVTYRDKTHADWIVRVAAPGGAVKELGTVRGRGDGAWRTATFRAPAPAPGSLGPGVDFALHVLGQENVTVRFVRVLRLDPVR